MRKRLSAVIAEVADVITIAGAILWVWQIVKVNSKSLMPFGMGLFYFANSLIPAGIEPVKQPTCRESYQGGLF